VALDRPFENDEKLPKDWGGMPHISPFPRRTERGNDFHDYIIIDYNRAFNGLVSGCLYCGTQIAFP